jgi:dihydroorotate dehydrogenase
MFPYSLAAPILLRLDPERAHRIAVAAVKLGLAGRDDRPDPPQLACTLWGLHFPNPIGLAAGFDKDAEVFDPMLRLGFGFVEAGSVTPRPQPGNPKPRLFRLVEDGAVINRFGFNSRGLDPFALRLAARSGAGIVGANLGKNKETEDAALDYAQGIAAVAPHADYLVCNVSSPNTPGLRGLQARGPIMDILGRLVEARDRAATGRERPLPLLTKVGPDLTEEQVSDIAEVALVCGIDGLIVGNTTITRPPGLQSRHREESGGLSGRPLFELANACLAAMYRYTKGRIPIIGCGGVASGADAYAKIRAGANLVQLYSALVYRGPGLVRTIKDELAALLTADGFASVADAVGIDQNGVPRR